MVETEFGNAFNPLSHSFLSSELCSWAEVKQTTLEDNTGTRADTMMVFHHSLV